MATDETASPQRPIEPELEAVKQALAAREAEISSLRQLLDARTAELAVRNSAYSEQIEHQAATIDVLRAMSSTTSDTQLVFDIILHRAVRLCNCTFGGLFEYDGELMHVRAAHGFHPGVLENFTRQFPMAPTRAIFAARAILDRQTVSDAGYRRRAERAPSLAGPRLQLTACSAFAARWQRDRRHLTRSQGR
jgi:hypothetical protein